MRQFFKFMFASMLGFVLSMFILFFLLALLVSGLVKSSADSPVTVDAGSILKLELNQEIHDRASQNPFEQINLSSLRPKHQLGLNEILKSIRKAKTDDNISGIYLELSVIPAGMASIEEIRQSLIEFKKSKKFIVAYSEYYTQKAYYLASVADAIYLNPAGNMEWKGIGAQLMFFKGTLEKLEVEPQVIRHGKFKSAVEPYILDKMSPESRIQTSSFILGIWNHWLDNISIQRNIKQEELNNLANTLSVQQPEDALKYGLIDKVAYADEFETDLRKRLALTAKEGIPYVSLAKYIKVPGQSKERISMDKIAIIYAEGDIESGEGEDESIGSERIVKALQEARKDAKVKAVVLRVNSPGGSALASDVIWRECLLTKQTKPFVVSMGNYAASGGYYISCMADKIVASPTTITGSIGVFGLILNTQKLLNNKLGISIDTVNSNKYADFSSAVRALSSDEKAVLQNSVERVYDDFISKVAAGRKLPKAAVDSIGQGRVWSGIDAKRIGLVDEFGGLERAVELAAKLAKIDKYRWYNLPRQKDPLEQLINDFTGDAETKLLKSKLGPNFHYLERIRSLSKQNRTIQACMEYEISLY